MQLETYNRLIGAHIKSTREGLGLSQKDVAAFMGINEQNISAYERGLRNPGTFWIYRFCDSLNVDPIDFYYNFYQNVLFKSK